MEHLIKQKINKVTGILARMARITNNFLLIIHYSTEENNFIHACYSCNFDSIYITTYSVHDVHALLLEQFTKHCPEKFNKVYFNNIVYYLYSIYP